MSMGGRLLGLLRGIFGGSLLLCGLKTCRQFAEAGSGIGAEPAPKESLLGFLHQQLC